MTDSNPGVVRNCILGLLTATAMLTTAAQPQAADTAAQPQVAATLAADSAPFPKYKPSSRSPEPIDIRTNAYGASRSAPDALPIGAVVPDFTLPKAGGGVVSLAARRAKGPVALIFYRGHW